MAIGLEDVWVLVFDSTRARIVRGLAGAGRPAAAELVLKTESRNLLDSMSDRSGRAFGHGWRSHMDGGSDPVKADERQFLREVVAVLESHRRANEIHRLALFGEPRVLGLLRSLLPMALRRLVVCEMPLNLVHVSPHDLPQVVQGYLGKRT